jgi:hypothetical protein
MNSDSREKNKKIGKRKCTIQDNTTQRETVQVYAMETYHS